MPALNISILRCLPAIAIGMAAAALSSSAAIAAPNDNCQIQISNPVIDYGQVTRAELLERPVSATAFSIGKQTLTLSATCRQPTLMTFFFRGAGGDGNRYRFGASGNFTLNLSTAQLDGMRVRLGNVNVPGLQPDRIADTAVLSPGIGIVPVVDERPVRGTSFSVQVEVDTQVLGIASRVADKTVWRSSGSFELVEN